MEELFDWMQEAQNSVHPLILSSVFHYEFVFIHPFSEAMAEWQGYGILLSFPGGSRYLNIFQLRVRLKSFKTNIMMRSPDVMEYDIPYTSTAFMGKLGLKSREGFRRNYLRPAIDRNLIQMTIPNKPNSRNQRYVKI